MAKFQKMVSFIGLSPGWAIRNNPLQRAILKPASADKNSKRISNQAFFRATSNKSYY
jgi:hypothetical protein